MTEIVHSGYRGKKPTAQELAFHVEAARQAEKVACSRYTKLRGAVIDWLESRGLENEGAYLIRLEREVGRQR